MEHAGLTSSEAFVASLCKSSFLSLWCIPNPPSKPGKELCDLLVVCDPDVIIFSVKEIGLKRDEAGEVTEAGAARWTRKAIDESIKQLRGAERFLADADGVKRADGSDGLPLPPPDRRRVHRIAVAFGSGREFPYASTDEGGGFVHVFDEVSFQHVMKELDTISDFVNYLTAKEKLLDHGPVVAFGEENLLGLYLLKGRTFPENHDVLIVNDDLWAGLATDAGFQRGKEEDKESHHWDKVIEQLVRDEKDGKLKISGAMPNGELATRTMARETRFARRTLARAMRAFLDDHRAGKTTGRAIPSESHVGYVFMSSNRPARDRIPELTARCFIMRGRLKDCPTIVGLNAMVVEGGGLVFEVTYWHQPTWTDADDAEAKKLAKDTGLFATPAEMRLRIDEYPPASSGEGQP